MNDLDLARLPKVELHHHLDCSLSFDVVSRLRPSVTRDEFNREFMAPAKCMNLADFLSRVSKSLELLQTKHQLRLATEDLFRQLRRDGHIYAEIRFAPFLHTELGLRPEDVVEIVESAASKASRATGVETRLILCTLRHFTQAQSLRTAQLVERFKGSLVAALDIAGDEAGFPLQAHIVAFRYAIEHHLPRTSHAGEARGPDSVWETLKRFQPSRLGHGVRSIEDPELIERLKQQDIHLEVCPTSNVQVDVYQTYADHPINRLYAAGVSVGVNTDSYTVNNVSLSEEYARLRRVFGWGKTHFLRCNLNALRASFLPPSAKQRLDRQLLEAYTEAGTTEDGKGT